jgi:hypothetical protein
MASLSLLSVHVYLLGVQAEIPIMMKVPEFKDLPIRSDAPPKSAWGVFDKDGKRDVYGTLNFITPEAVVAARMEIQTGESAVLK